MRARITLLSWAWGLVLLTTLACCVHCASAAGLSALCGGGLVFDPAAGRLVPASALGRILASPQCLMLITLSAAMSVQHFAARRRKSVFDLDQQGLAARHLQTHRKQNLGDMRA